MKKLMMLCLLISFFCSTAVCYEPFIVENGLDETCTVILSNTGVWFRGHISFDDLQIPMAWLWRDDIWCADSSDQRCAGTVVLHDATKVLYRTAGNCPYLTADDFMYTFLIYPHERHEFNYQSAPSAGILRLDNWMPWREIHDSLTVSIVSHTSSRVGHITLKKNYRYRDACAYGEPWLVENMTGNLEMSIRRDGFYLYWERCSHPIK